jgi:hypothetical protein
MRACRILDQDNQHRRQTVADALAVLDTRAAFGSEDTVEIPVGLMPLSPEQNVGLVLLVFDLPHCKMRCAVPLPSAKTLKAGGPMAIVTAPYCGS